MKLFFRYFFRTVRLILTPVMLASEKLSTPKTIARTAEQQAQMEQASRGLALYQYRACPFCIRVRKEMARLGLPVEKRDVQHDPTHRAALQAGGGKIKVPCLRIEHEDGREQWLYESAAINAWLREQFEPACAK